LLGDHAEHSHAEGAPAHHHTDHNLKAAYLHVLADALTSILAIAALLAGWLWGWLWMDAAMGIIGSLLISRWALGLLRDTNHILLDGSSNEHLIDAVRSRVEGESDSRISDLHIWQIGEHAWAAIVALVTHEPRPVEHYRQLLGGIPELQHVTIEVSVCGGPPCIPVNEARR